MERTKKYLVLSCTLGIFALTACQMFNSTEEVVVDDTSINPYAMPIQENTPLPAPTADVLPAAQMDTTSAGVPMASGTMVPVPQPQTASYTREEVVVSYVPVEQKATHPCYQVQRGQIVGTAPGQVSNTVSGIPCAVENKAAYPAGRYAAANQAQKAGIAPKAAPQTGVVNIETPARCQVALKNNEIISNVPLNADSFKMTLLDRSDVLPRYEVNDYTFKNVPLDLAIQNLVSEAGIRVYSDDALFPEVSGDNIRGELSAVIDELTAAGDVFYRYDAAKKQLILSRWARFIMQVPGGRVGMYTVLDALRGANITNIHADFGANEISMRINKENETVIGQLIDTIKASPELLMFDIRVYRLTKRTDCGPIDWQNIIQNYGVTKVNTSVNGIMGRILTMDHQPRHKTLVDSLRRYGSLSLISEGVAVMPNGWKVRFDIGQCAKFQTPEQDLSMLFQTNILKDRRAESNIALDTVNGEITSFNTFYNIDDSMNIIGIPGRVFNPAWKDNVEYVITLQPRLLRLVK